MTPLGGFFKRILGSGSTPATPPAVTRTNSATGGRGPTRSPAPDARRDEDRRDDEREDARSGRSRGSRGGRGRGTGASNGGNGDGRASNGGDARSTQPRGGNDRGRGNGGGGTPSGEPRAYGWANRPGRESNETEEQARQRREQASRQRRGGGRSSFRPYRENLDAPLPEDIAFRSGAEGGDRTILPARRRRGTGLRDTARVIVGGARTLSGWSRPISGVEETVAPAPARRAPEPRPDQHDDHDDRDEFAPNLPVPVADLRAPRPATDDLDAEALEDTDEIDGDGAPDASEDGGAPRRRRGRRGGRGRRRPGTAEPISADDLEPSIAELRDQPVAAVPDDAIYDLDEPLAVHDDEIDEPEDDPHAEEREAERAAVEAAAAQPTRRTARPRALEPIDPESLPAAFAELGVGERTLHALARFGFTTPTPIQVRAIPALVKGRDVVGVAQTGSGKTIAFGVPMVECLDPELAEVQGLVLVPTRELASQVLDVLKDLAAGFGLEAVGILGGHSLAGDFKALERRPAIVVGTPGRVIDHLQRGTLSLRYVRYAVLDEADQMLDIGFLPDIRRILSRTPKRRQTALFSATMPSTIRRLVWQFMDDPETVTVDPELSTVDTIDQVYFEVASRDKAKGLRELVEVELKGRTLVFCKMKRGVDRLEADLARQGVRVGALHGDMDQRRRERVVQDFRAGELDVLIATNVAACGLDIPEITHVVNFDVPQNPEEYVHRIGRTGRAGRDGKAITFVSEWDMREWDAIAGAFGDHLRREELSIYSR